MRKEQEEERSRAKEGRRGGRGVRGTKGGGTQVKRPSAWQAVGACAAKQEEQQQQAEKQAANSTGPRALPGPGAEPQSTDARHCECTRPDFFRYRDSIAPSSLSSSLFPKPIASKPDSKRLEISKYLRIGLLLLFHRSIFESIENSDPPREEVGFFGGEQMDSSSVGRAKAGTEEVEGGLRRK